MYSFLYNQMCASAPASYNIAINASVSCASFRTSLLFLMGCRFHGAGTVASRDESKGWPVVQGIFEQGGPIIGVIVVRNST